MDLRTKPGENIKEIKKKADEIVIRMTKNKYDYSQEPVQQEWGAEVYPGRTNWASHTDYIMAGLAFLLGVSGISFFPYTCYTHGKALFFIPYGVSLVFVSMPLMLMEIALGQYTSQSALTCWKMAPAFKAIGVGMLIITVPVAVYYIMTTAWCLHYIYFSMVNLMGDLPWTTCDQDYNSPYCASRLHGVNESFCLSLHLEARNNGVCYNGTVPYGLWDEQIALQNDVHRVSPSIEYFSSEVLDIDDGDAFEKIEGIRWTAAITLGAAWLLVYMVLFYGVKFAGKIAYIAVIIPPVVFLALLGFLLIHDGGFNGLKLFITDLDWTILWDIEVWKTAVRLSVFSTGAVGGCMIVMSSYSSFHSNLLRDTMIFAWGDTLMNMIGTALLFVLIGYTNANDNTPIDFSQGGTTIVFGFFPRALSHLPMSNIVVLIYFITVFTMGFCSQFLFTKCIVTSVLDMFPTLHKPKYCRCFLGLIVLTFCGIGSLMCTESGFYIYYFLQSYASGGNLLIVGFLESVGIAWFYGVQNFRQDIGIMMGSQRFLGFYWRQWSKYFAICWTIVSPVLLAAVAVVTYTELSPLSYGNYVYPEWTAPLGLLVAAATIVGILVTCAFSICKTKGSFKEKIKKNFTRDTFWGPALVKHRVKVVHLKNFNIDPHWQGAVRLAHES